MALTDPATEKQIRLAFHLLRKRGFSTTLLTPATRVALRDVHSTANHSTVHGWLTSMSRRTIGQLIEGLRGRTLAPPVLSLQSGPASYLLAGSEDALTYLVSWGDLPHEVHSYDDGTAVIGGAHGRYSSDDGSDPDLVAIATALGFIVRIEDPHSGELIRVAQPTNTRLAKSRRAA